MKARAYRLGPGRSFRTPRSGPAHTFEDSIDALVHGDRRTARILDSLRHQIVEGGESQSLRIRQVFQGPREIYRIELELPEMSYQRTTLLDRDALEDLLEIDEVRAAVGRSLY